MNKEGIALFGIIMAIIVLVATAIVNSHFESMTRLEAIRDADDPTEMACALRFYDDAPNCIMYQLQKAP